MGNVASKNLEFTNLFGQTVSITLAPIPTRKFFEVIHTTIVSALSLFQLDNGKASIDLKNVLNAIDFDRFALIAGTLLNGCVIDGVGTVQNIFDHDYFASRPDELYTATFHALMAVNPELFLRLKAELGKLEKGSALPVTEDAVKA